MLFARAHAVLVLVVASAACASSTGGARETDPIDSTSTANAGNAADAGAEDDVPSAVTAVTTATNSGDASSGTGTSSGDDDDDAGQVLVEGPPPTVSGSDALSTEARSILASLTSTKYQHTSNVDATAGVFDVDCSGFMNFALATAVSDAYNTLLSTSMVTRPLAQTYVDFIASLALPKGRWHHVTHAADLIPGDVIAWKTPPGVQSSDTGHVMVVDAAPVLVMGQNDGDAGAGGEVQVAVIDSTDTGHGSSDARSPTGTTGVGRGTVALIVGTDGDATGYRWSTDVGSPPETTEVILAHLD